MRTMIRVGAGLVLVLFTTLTGTTPAGANPISTGCPTGHPLTSVASLTATGHLAPARIDAAGNADGYVCARLLPDAVCIAQHGTCPVAEFYLLTDNDLPLGQAQR